MEMRDILKNMLKYTIPQIPPSENKFKGRQNVWEYRSLKKEWAQIINIYCRPRPTVALPNKVNLIITYYFPTKIRHDPNNYSGQFITDGLVKCGILRDDSFENFNLIIKGDYDKEKPRTEIFIEEV